MSAGKGGPFDFNTDVVMMSVSVKINQVFFEFFVGFLHVFGDKNRGAIFLSVVIICCHLDAKPDPNAVFCADVFNGEMHKEIARRCDCAKFQEDFINIRVVFQVGFKVFPSVILREEFD